VVQRRENPVGVGVHIRDDRRRQTAIHRFPRLTRNHRSIVVRRNIVAQPPVVIIIVVRRKTVSLVNG
jgi:hypothetical protein